MGPNTAGKAKKVKKRKSQKIRVSIVNIPMDVPRQPAPAPKVVATKPKVVSGSTAGIVAKLPSMSLAATVGVWRNAMAALKDPQRKHLRNGAHEVLAALDAEWKRRGAGQERPEDWFKWPGADASLGDGSLTLEWLEEGVLKFLGYQVGKSSDLSSPLREAILGRVFGGEIPPAFAQSYLAEWGVPASSMRLRKMAESIASFARNAKRRRDERLDQAIEDWEHDLQFLHDEYYIGRFRFAWPVTAA